MNCQDQMHLITLQLQPISRPFCNFAGCEYYKNVLWITASYISWLKKTLKAFNDSKIKQREVCEVMSFDICESICILKVYSIHYTLR